MKKVIAVVGATGAQGGSLCRAILADKSGEYTVRALTRYPDKPAARALQAAGAEVVRADLDRFESLKRAFHGAYGVYGVTNFWEHGSAMREKLQAQSIALATKIAGVKHAIWSTLEDTRRFMVSDDPRMPFLQDKYRVPHFDAKAEADAFFVGQPVTMLLTSFYWDNLLTLGMAPKRGEDGVYRWALPMGEEKLAGIAAEDIGKCAFGIFKAGQRHIGGKVAIMGEALTVDEMSRTLERVLGVSHIQYDAIEPDVYRGFGFPGAEEIGNMFQVYRDFAGRVVTMRNPATARRLNPELVNFERWTLNNRSALLKQVSAPADLTDGTAPLDIGPRDEVLV